MPWLGFRFDEFMFNCIDTNMVSVCHSCDLYASAFFDLVGGQLVVEVEFLLFNIEVRKLVVKRIPMVKSLGNVVSYWRLFGKSYCMHVGPVPLFLSFNYVFIH